MSAGLPLNARPNVIVTVTGSTYIRTATADRQIFVVAIYSPENAVAVQDLGSWQTPCCCWLSVQALGLRQSSCGAAQHVFDGWAAQELCVRGLSSQLAKPRWPGGRLTMTTKACTALRPFGINSMLG